MKTTECLKKICRTSGNLSSASTSGFRSSASTSGFRSSASTSGFQSCASTSGELSAAAITGEGSTVDISASSAAAICADKFFWVVRKGAVVVQRWLDKDSGETKTAVFDSSEMDVKDGDTLTIVKGEIK